MSRARERQIAPIPYSITVRIDIAGDVAEDGLRPDAANLQRALCRAYPLARMSGISVTAHPFQPPNRIQLCPGCGKRTRYTRAGRPSSQHLRSAFHVGRTSRGPLSAEELERDRRSARLAATVAEIAGSPAFNLAEKCEHPPGELCIRGALCSYELAASR